MKLEPGELICDKCEGGGSYPKKFAKLEDPYFSCCPKCLGTGKLDWIEMCMGRAINFVTMGNNPCSTITLPKVRSMYPKLMAKELVSVQPINWDEKNEKD